MDSAALLLLAQAMAPDTQVVPTGGQLISATSYTPVFSWGVDAGVLYRFRAAIAYIAAASAGLPSLELTAAGGAVVSWTGYNFTYAGGVTDTYQTICKTALSTVLNGPSMNASDTYQFTVEGSVVFTTGGAGGFRVSAATSSASDTWTIQQGSYMTLKAIP